MLNYINIFIKGGFVMKSKKIISMVLAAGIATGGFGAASTKAFAATSDTAQETIVISQKDSEAAAYDILKEVKENPNEANIKKARKALTGLTDPYFKSAYEYLLSYYTKGITDVPAIDELMAVYAKSEQINSGEVKANLGMKLDQENLNEEYKNTFDMVQAMVNSTNMNMNLKINSESETKASISGTFNMNMAGQEMDMKVWADADISNDEPNIKYIIQIPEVLKAGDPMLANKDYLVYDLEDIIGQGIDMSEFNSIMESATVFSAKLDKSFENFIKLADAKYDIVERTDVAKLDADGSKGLVKAYTVDLNNEKLMSIVKDALQDKEIMKTFKDYIDDIMALNPEYGSITDEDFNNGLKEVEAALDEINNVAKFDVTYQMGVNKQGYISTENVSFKITLKASALSEIVSSLAGTEMPAFNPDATFTFTLNCNSDTTNINKNVKLDAKPEITEDNSVNLVDLMTVEAQAEAEAE